MAGAEGLLVKVRGDASGLAAAAGLRDAEPILHVPAGRADSARGLAAGSAATWLRLGSRYGDSENAWDRAHALLAPGQPFATGAGGQVEAIEPDFVQDWPHRRKPVAAPAFAAASGREAYCAFEAESEAGGQARGGSPGWSFGDGFSELAKARERVGEKQRRVVIAHLDTGYDPAHVTLPEGLRRDAQRNFVADGGAQNDASDRTPPGMELVRNRGHGTGTLSLLAGNRLDGTSPGWPGVSGHLGGAPLAQVIPVRVADWVVRLSTGTLVQGFDYARRQGAHVLSLSMGGLSSDALCDAVNLAYDHGVVMVAAAGNNFSGAPMPASIVFPARFLRVLAACGVMADGRAYYGLDLGTMQGNYGPEAKMGTALAAYAPNVPWAKIGCAKVVDMDGVGTSSATPQIAAAAALWLAEHWDAVALYSRPWMRIEAVRHALFSAAAKTTPRMGQRETFEKLGRGVLKAHAALDVRPPAESQLRRLPPAQASWSWLDLIWGGGVSLAATLGPPGGRLPPRAAMLRLELTQMAQRVRAVDEAIDDPGRPAEEIPASARNRYLEAALDEGEPSRPLRALLEQILRREAAPMAEAPKPPKAPIARKAKPAPAPPRRLRIYALDPSVAKRLDSVAVHATTLSLPWDDEDGDADTPGAKLRPGPVGEYLEVVDVDPASNKIYEPVDLNDPMLLAQDGWPPSEGNPQFHQQMAYAVGMTTIGHFERALGRRALWAPHYPDGETGETRREAREVRRLRIYPHALRAENAYYSPDKKALLFGYFTARPRDGDATSPGSTVFTCLSSDIIAHEMSHALLDGLHRRFQEASNPDVPAFHEAFADIVALFQHFTLTELLRFEIGRARGDVTAAGLLSGLARQFGEGSGRAGPLRDYGTRAARTLSYATTMEPHDRGSILVFAVYDAFLGIVARRTDDLVRLATGGTGVLAAGALHPGLVELLAEETAKAAAHVLRMCIRALDYCPAVDITFGEYLRALITADIDLVPDDRYHYRVAFMEAFRKWSLLPRDVRTVSEETLAWSTLDDPSPAWLGKLVRGLDLGWNQRLDRSQIFRLNEENRWRLHHGLREALAREPALYTQFGLLADLPRYGADGAIEKPADMGQSTFDVLGVRPTRRVAPDGSFLTEVVAVIQQRRPLALDGRDMANGWVWFRGGATLLIDPDRGREAIRYAIVKRIDSASRQDRQRSAARAGFLSPLRALYFGEAVAEPFAMMHADHGSRSDG